MKSPTLLAGAFIVAMWGAQAIAETNSLPASSNSVQVATALGWQTAHEKEVNGIEISESELTNFIAGFSLGAKDLRLPLDMQQIFPDVDALATVRQRRVIEAIKHESSKAAEGYLANWRRTATVSELPDGVCYQVIRNGATVARPAQTVKVHYVAELVNGAIVTEFGPDDVLLVTNHLNHGLFEGFRKIGVDGEMKLYLPPALAEHEVEIAGAPHGSALVYEVELLGVKDTPTNELADALLPPAPESPPPAYSGRFPTNEVIKAWGWQIAQQTRLWKLSLDENEMAGLAKGFENGVHGNPPPTDAAQMQRLVEMFANERKLQYQERFREKQTATMNALFADLDKNTNVIKLPDGLRYEILKPGSGPSPKTAQIVLVNYTARTLDGHIFDQTANEPLHVEVRRVIPGWNEGIQKICVGGKIKLYIPPSLGYGGDAVSGIPAYSTLIYEIELLRIENKAEK